MESSMFDPYQDVPPSVTSPAETSFAIDPSDSQALAYATKAAFIGTGGDLTVRLARDSEDRTFRNLANAQVLDIRVTHVRATGTTASDIVGFA